MTRKPTSHRVSDGDLRNDERAVSSTVGAVLNIGLALLFGTAVVTLGFTVVTQKNTVGMENKFEEQGQFVSDTIQEVDRLVRQSDGEGPIAKRVDLPDRIHGQAYTIAVINSSDASSGSRCGPPADTPDVGCLILEPNADGMGQPQPITVYFATGPSTTVVSTTVDGGPLRVIRKEGAGTFVVVEEL